MVSLCVILEPYVLPTHTLYPFAIGNTASCSTIGFLVRAFAMCVSLYNCYFSIYFLLLIRYSWKSEDISKVELYFYILAVILPLTFGIAGIATNSYNPRGLLHICDYADYPRACSNFDKDVECIRGEHAYQIDWASVSVLFLSTTIGAIASYTVYRTVRHRIKATLRRSFQGDCNEHIEAKIKTVATQSMLYTLAYLNSSMWPGAVAWVTWFVDTRGREGELGLYVLQLLAWIFFPLQGFFSFFIYIRLRFCRIRQQNPDRSLFCIFRKTMEPSSAEASSPSGRFAVRSLSTSGQEQQQPVEELPESSFENETVDFPSLE